MKTPKEFSDNLKKGIVTEAMLEQVLFSYNKRAKNYRDQIRKQHFYYGSWDPHGYIESNEEKKDEIYSKKEKILSLCPQYLAAIHCLVRRKKVRVCDDEEDYGEYVKNVMPHKLGKETPIIKIGSYWDRDEECEVHFIDIWKDVKEYYLFYEFPNYSFHSPIEQRDLMKYEDVRMIELEELETKGKDINELLSCQFCDKVFALVKNGTTIYK